MSQRVIPFVQWLRLITIAPHKVINSLTRKDLADTTLKQRQGIRTSLVPPPTPPPSQAFPQHQSVFQLPAAPVLSPHPLRRQWHPPRDGGRTSWASSSCTMSLGWKNSRRLAHSIPPQEVQSQGHHGSNMSSYRQWPLIPLPHPHTPHRWGYGNDSCLPYWVPWWGGVRAQHLSLSWPLLFGWVGISISDKKLGRDLRGGGGWLTFHTQVLWWGSRRFPPWKAGTKLPLICRPGPSCARCSSKIRRNTPPPLICSSSSRKFQASARDCASKHSSILPSLPPSCNRSNRIWMIDYIRLYRGRRGSGGRIPKACGKPKTSTSGFVPILKPNYYLKYSYIKIGGVMFNWLVWPEFENIFH